MAAPKPKGKSKPSLAVENIGLQAESSDKSASAPKAPAQRTLTARNKREFHEVVRKLFKVDPKTFAVFSKSQQPDSVQDNLRRILKRLARKWKHPYDDLSTRATEYANWLHNDHGIVKAEGVPLAPDVKQRNISGEVGNIVDPVDVIERPLPRRPGFFRRELQYDPQRW